MANTIIFSWCYCHPWTPINASVSERKWISTIIESENQQPIRDFWPAGPKLCHDHGRTTMLRDCSMCGEERGNSKKSERTNQQTSGHPELMKKTKKQKNSGLHGQRKMLIACTHSKVGPIKACPCLSSMALFSYKHACMLLTLLSAISALSLCPRKTLFHYPAHTPSFREKHKHVTELQHVGIWALGGVI